MLNPLMTRNFDDIFYIVYDPPISISNKETFLQGFQAIASELLKNFEEMFPRYYMGKAVITRFKSSTTHIYVPRRVGYVYIYCLYDMRLIVLCHILSKLTHTSTDNHQV